MRIKAFLSIIMLIVFVSFQAFCQDQDPPNNKKIVVLGSSVASGWVSSYKEKYDMQNGYAYRLARLLEPKGWEVVNISIPGFDTRSTIERFADDVLPLDPGYVLIGLSMSNEGLETANPDTVFDSYRNGIEELISLCKTNKIEPVVGLCYSNDNYTEEQYAYLKKMNRMIASWDVPTINLLGVLDDGHGHFPAGYTFDPNHPDDRGHEEMFYAFVPDMFEALHEGWKPGKYDPDISKMLNLGKKGKYNEVDYVPSEVMHSFTLFYNFNFSGPSSLLRITTSKGDKILSVTKEGILMYGDEEIRISTAGTHQMTFSHQYLTQNTVVFIDGNPLIQLKEQLEPLCLTIGSERSKMEVSRLLIYRSALAFSGLVYSLLQEQKSPPVFSCCNRLCFYRKNAGLSHGRVLLELSGT